MAWQDPTNPESRLKLKIRPTGNFGWAMKVWGVGLGVTFATTVFVVLASLATGTPAKDIGPWFVMALGSGLVFGIYLLIARFTRVWDKL